MQKCDKLTLKQTRELQNVVSDSKSSGREVRRAQAILMLNEEVVIKTIVSQTIYSRRQIFDLRKNYLDKGISSIKDKKKGKPRELLTKKQLAEIVNTVKEKTPRDYGYDTDYWTTGIVGAVIESDYKVK
jgi:transposase